MFVIIPMMRRARQKHWAVCRPRSCKNSNKKSVPAFKFVFFLWYRRFKKIFVFADEVIWKFIFIISSALTKLKFNLFLLLVQSAFIILNTISQFVFDTRIDRTSHTRRSSCVSSGCWVAKNFTHLLFNQINRGGLWRPTPDLFGFGCLCWSVFAELFNDSLQQRFYRRITKEKFFSEIVSLAFYENTVVSSWSMPAMCDEGHNILKGITTRFYNCMFKNMMRQLNDTEAVKASGKIRKLCGKSGKS